MSIKTAGLVVVFLPLLFACFVAGLNLLQSISLERFYQKEAHSRALLSDSTTLSRLFIDAANCLLHFYATREQKDLARLLLIRQRIAQKVEDIDKLVSHHPAELKAFRPVRDDVAEALFQIESIVSILSSDLSEDSALTAYERRQRLESILQETVEHMDIFLGFAKASQVQELDIQSKKRAEQRMSALFFLLASLLLASVLSIVFFKNITQRLAVIVDNTARVERGEDLNLRLSGKDEIANLDETFHKMYASLQAEKARAERLEAAKREFYAMVTHDLRSPLASISLTVELLIHDLSKSLTEKYTRHLRLVYASVSRLNNLIDNFLDMEKLSAGKYEMEFSRANVLELVDRAEAAIEALLTENDLRLEKSVNAQLFVYADPERIIQVLVNLIANAIKFSPPGSTITVSVEPCGDKQLEFKVRDRGPGIPADKQALLFDRFSQLEEGKKVKGTGLGLAICKMIIDQHEGEIGVHTESPPGSEFWFRLMRAE